MRCKYYLPWVETSRGEIDDACVNSEKRTIKQCCYWNAPEFCPKFNPEFCPKFKEKEDKK